MYQIFRQCKYLILTISIFSPGIRGIGSPGCSDKDVVETRLGVMGANEIVHTAQVAVGVTGLIEKADPTKVSKIVHIAAQGVLVAATIGSIVAQECYDDARWSAELKYHEDIMVKLAEVNHAIEQATAKLSEKFREVEMMLANVVQSVSKAVDSIKKILAYEAQRIWDEVSLNVRTLLKEFHLTTKSSELKLFYGYCLSTKLQDPESVLKTLLSILRMENNPFLILAESGMYNDKSVSPYVAMIALSCSQLEPAWETCDHYKGNYSIRNPAILKMMTQKRKKTVRELAESINALNNHRNKLYFKEENLKLLFASGKYGDLPRGFDATLSDQFTYFYMDTDEFKMRRKYVYSLEFNGKEAQEAMPPDPEIVGCINKDYVSFLNVTLSDLMKGNRPTPRTRMYVVRSFINDPDIFLPNEFTNKFDTLLGKYQNKDTLIDALQEIYKTHFCTNTDGIVLTSIFLLDIKDLTQYHSYYGFGKCISRNLFSYGSPVQVVWCYHLADVCPKMSDAGCEMVNFN